MSTDTIVGTDIYMRFGKGPIQQFRVWDAGLFIDARMAEGLQAKGGPIVVTVHTPHEYAEQRRASK